MIKNVRKHPKSGIINTKNFFSKNTEKLVISGIEKNSYEIFKRKSERLLRIFEEI